MRQLIPMTLVALMFVGTAHAQTTYHIGVGDARQYAGLGLSLERVTDQDKITLGAGLVHSHRVVGELWGAALMYHRFDLIAADTGRHALGVGIAPVASRWSYRFRIQPGQPTEYETQYHHAVYGGVLAYNYHPRGAALGGFHVGASYGYGRRDGASSSNIHISVGYRF